MLKFLTAMLAISLSAGIAVAQQASPDEPQADLDQTVESLRRQLRDQEARLRELEGRKEQQVTRDEVIAIVKEMTADAQARSNDLRAYWKEGLRLETANGDFALKIGGRIQADFGWANADDELEAVIGEVKDGTEFRRARLFVEGKIYEHYFYKLQLDFAGSEVALKDAYLGMGDIPVVGAVKVGHFKEPFSLNELTSSKYTTFMERALPNVFAPSRNMGIGIGNAVLNKRMTWAAGLFRETDDQGSVTSDSGYNLTGRVTALPFYREEGKYLVHVGAGYSYRTPNDGDTLRYRQRPEAHFTQRFVDTGSFALDSYHLMGGELATVIGPFHAAGEFIASVPNADEGPNPCFKGFYAQAGYFLTGEHRPYKTSSGTWDKVKPLRPFREDGGLGAWELAVRYSYLDLDEGGIGGAGSGELSDVTLGLNWYLNTNMRIMWNYVRAMTNRRDADGDANLLMMRFQVFF